ncbi:MAG: SDR family oxidoreductase, partial [Bacteroidetes bacterium]|nr:SDR family oxidoreductase [Bacteroidota bacterium]
MPENKKAIVTGGSRGIGRAIVKYLAEQNCSKILLSDIAFENGPEECAKDIKSDINNTKAEIFAFKADA